MTPQEQDEIDDAVDFVVQTKNGIIAEVNQLNTVIKARSVGDIATFLDVYIKNHTVVSYSKSIDIEYPLLKLVVSGINLLPNPDKIYYKKQRVLITVYGDVVLGIAPMGDIK